MDNSAKNNRREFLKTTGKAGLAAGLAATVIPALAERYSNVSQPAFSISAEEIPYEQQPLPYKYNALEPAIDAMTMEIHYTKHAATYAKNLSDATKAEGIDTSIRKLTEVLANISKYSVKMRNNGGGHYNHEFFWKSMRSPQAKNLPTGTLDAAITKDFGSFNDFSMAFADAGKNRFGSGWAWLVKTKNKLVVTSTPNQDNPLMDLADVKGIPLLGLDVWEHAYYLKYQNKRPDYIQAFWSIINWDVVQGRYNG